MTDTHDTYGAKQTFTRATIADPNGIVESFATSTSAVDLDDPDNDFDGAEIEADSGGRLSNGIPRTVSVTTGAVAGAYELADITLFGLYGGVEVSEVLTLTEANGGETIRGKQPFDVITRILVDAMADTDGTLEFGVADIVSHRGKMFRGVKADADGVVVLQYGSVGGLVDPQAAGALVDALPIGTGIEDVLPFAVLVDDRGTPVATDVGVTVYV